MIEWKPMESLTFEQERGEIIIKWSDSGIHEIFQWYPGSQAWRTPFDARNSLPSEWLRNRCEGWQRLK